jgi:hypothetical protein
MLSQQVAAPVSSTPKAHRKIRLPLNVTPFCGDVYSLRLLQGASMTDKQNGKTEPKKANPGKIALMGAVATALAVFNLATNGGEAPRQALLILQYALLACGLFALGGGLIMMLSAKN